MLFSSAFIRSPELRVSAVCQAAWHQGLFMIVSLSGSEDLTVCNMQMYAVRYLEVPVKSFANT